MESILDKKSTEIQVLEDLEQIILKNQEVLKISEQENKASLDNSQQIEIDLVILQKEDKKSR